jgi:hypothetical protein
VHTSDQPTPPIGSPFLLNRQPFVVKWELTCIVVGQEDLCVQDQDMISTE